MQAREGRFFLLPQKPLSHYPQRGQGVDVLSDFG